MLSLAFPLTPSPPSPTASPTVPFDQTTCRFVEAGSYSDVVESTSWLADLVSFDDYVDVVSGVNERGAAHWASGSGSAGFNRFGRLSLMMCPCLALCVAAPSFLLGKKRGVAYASTSTDVEYQSTSWVTFHNTSKFRYFGLRWAFESCGLRDGSTWVPPVLKVCRIDEETMKTYTERRLILVDANSEERLGLTRIKTAVTVDDMVSRCVRRTHDKLSVLRSQHLCAHVPTPTRLFVFPLSKLLRSFSFVSVRV